MSRVSIGVTVMVRGMDEIANKLGREVLGCQKLPFYSKGKAVSPRSSRNWLQSRELP